MRIAFFVSLIIQTNLPAQSTLEKVRSLNLSESRGAIPAIFSDGCEPQAHSIIRLLAGSTSYFKAKYRVEVSYTIAVLDSADWQKVSEIPYGLPFVSGPPYIVCFPATANNVLSELVLNAISRRLLDNKYSMSNADIVNLFVSLIGFHELGHIYSKAWGVDCPNKWTFEFVATYFAVSCLEEKFSRENETWRKVSRILVDEIRPDHTSLHDFEELYVRVEVENYAWYQVVFLLRVAEVQRDLGADFLYALNAGPAPSFSKSYYAEELEAVDFGFKDWALKYHLLD